MPHISTKGRARATAASMILLLAALGLAACGSSGGSSSTSAQTAANAAATGTPTTSATATATTPSGTSTSGPSSTGTTSTGTTPAGQPNEARYNEVRECLAQKGVVLPQRTHGAAGLVAGGNGIKVPKGMSHAQLAEALRTCNVKYAGGHVPPPGATAGRPLPERFRHVLARFAACLRQHGVPVGEPNTSGKGPIFNTKGINTGSPQFRVAAAKCRTALFGTPPRKTGSSSASASTSG